MQKNKLSDYISDLFENKSKAKMFQLTTAFNEKHFKKIEYEINLGNQFISDESYIKRMLMNSIAGSISDDKNIANDITSKINEFKATRVYSLGLIVVSPEKFTEHIKSIIKLLSDEQINQIKNDQPI